MRAGRADEAEPSAVATPAFALAYERAMLAWFAGLLPRSGRLTGFPQSSAQVPTIGL